MDSTTLDTANDISTNKGVLTTAIEFLPALGEGTPVDAAGFGAKLTALSQYLSAATDPRIPEAVNTALTAAYNALRTGLSDLNNTLQTEFEAL